jgi:hypothetical protein
MSQTQRAAILALAVLVLGGGFLLARSGSDNGSSTSTAAPATTTAASTGTTATTSVPAATTTTATTTTATTATVTTTATTTVPATPAAPVVTVKDGKPVGGVQKLQFAKGDAVRFTVASDVADEIHVHGYDVKKDVTAGGRVTFAFPAKIDGIFEVELENAGVQIAELKVTP